MKSQKLLKRLGIALACLLGALVLVVAGYVIFLLATYERIPDHSLLEPQNQQAAVLDGGETYTAVTYNIGFGAYEPEFSFFMDSGVMNDGTKVTGKQARARSADVVWVNTDGVIAATGAQSPDFCLFQEVDVDADRSAHIDQAAEIRQAMPGYASVFASNFHSEYLFYPLWEPHGAVESGLLTLSKYSIDWAERRSYPVAESFPAKLFDLDRCFALQRLPVAGGGELVLINSHMSAYDEGGSIRAAQMEMLAGVMAEERGRGNWVVVGGDFNHALCGTLEAFPSGQQVPEWVYEFDDAALPEGYRVVCADNATQVPTCRSSDIPYEPGVSYTVVVDGFIVSDNVKASAHNLDEGFQNSDHNPVSLTFTLA